MVMHFLYQGIETDASKCALDESEPQIHQSVLSVSISMPTSAIEIHLQDNNALQW